LSQHAAIGRLGQVCDRWIYSACLCSGLDSGEQARSGFRYAYSIYQAGYSRNLLFASVRQMEDLFDRIPGRTRSRLDIPTLPFGAPPTGRRSGAAAFQNQIFGMRCKRWSARLSWLAILVVPGFECFSGREYLDGQGAVELARL
jgi:hypothetical protein